MFPLSSSAAFATLQSRVHEVWARFLGSSLEDDLRYTPSDCFDTFPLPRGFDTDPTLERIGQLYDEHRGQMMHHYNKGLTPTYNEFHAPDSDWAEIVELRELHHAMDRAVLDAYGWMDIHPSCDFYPEFDADEDDEDETRFRPVRYRFRWPEEVRDEVLARLLELNRQRALEEGQVLTAVPVEGESPEASPKRKKSSANYKTSLFPEPKGVS